MGWMALIFILSAQPGLLEIDDEASEKIFYKSGHIIAYAILAWLWWRALAPRRQVAWSILSVAFSLTVLYGISDEIHQLFVPSRYGRLADVLFDASGALLAVLLLRRFRWLRFFPENWPLEARQQLVHLEAD
jgi:VanZ family protein